MVVAKLGFTARGGWSRIALVAIVVDVSQGTVHKCSSRKQFRSKTATDQPAKAIISTAEKSLNESKSASKLTIAAPALLPAQAATTL